ncbi:MAG: AAA family ATPase [Candidatus Babeliaceae bacterium]|nr:AAA family ATPase [Candidatus Babeliaceae bacterium]
MKLNLVICLCAGILITPLVHEVHAINTPTTKQEAPAAAVSSIVPEKASIPSPTTPSPEDEERTQRLKELYAIFNVLVETAIAKMQHISLTMRQLVNGKTDIDRARAWLRETTNVLTKLRHQQVFPLDETKILRLFYSLQLIIQIVTEELESQPPFANRFPLTLEKIYFTHRKFKKVSLSDLSSFAENNTLLVEQLAKKADQNGLTFFNRCYSKISDIEQRYHPISISASLLALGSITAGALFYFGPDQLFQGEMFKNRERYRKKIGEAALVAGGILETVNIAVKLNQSLGIVDGLGKFFNRIDRKLRGVKARPAESIDPESDGPLITDSCFNDIRKEIDEIFGPLIKFMKDPAVFTYTGTKPPSVIFIAGESGTGKTFLANAFLRTLDNEIGHIACVRFDPNADKNIEMLIERARLQVPAVVLIDEIQLAQLQHASNPDGLYSALKVLDELYNDTNPRSMQIIVLIMTNRLNLIDSAVLRTGRVDRILILYKPNKEQRLKIWQSLCEHYNVSLSEAEIDRLASASSQCTKSDIVAVFKHAFGVAKETNAPLSFETLYQSLYSIARKINWGHGLTHEEKAVIAAEIAGVTLAHYLCKAGGVIDAITVLPTQVPPREVYDWQDKLSSKTNKPSGLQQQYGNCYICNNNEQLKDAQTDKRTIIKTLVAGQAARELLNTGATSTFSKDRAIEAMNVAENLITKGIPFKKFAAATQDQFKQQAYEIVQHCTREIKNVLSGHLDILKKLADNLTEREFLRREDVEAIIQNT